MIVNNIKRKKNATCAGDSDQEGQSGHGQSWVPRDFHHVVFGKNEL